MSKLTIAFIHGGQHSGSCWSPTIHAIESLNNNIKTIAIDLPGHGKMPGDLATLTIDQCVESATTQILATHPEEVILVGHSMAGITIPGVATNLGSTLVKKIIFLACCIPAEGKRVVDTIQPPMSFIAKAAAKKNAVSPPIPKLLASWVFANGMTKEQKQLVFSDLRPESTKITLEPVTRAGFPKVPMAWIITRRDWALRPQLQKQFIKNLGGVDEVHEIDTCHDAMISEPVELAKLILSTQYAKYNPVN